MIREPSPRDLPPRSSENEKRALSPDPPSAEAIAHLLVAAKYEGYGKHKRHAERFGVPAYRGRSADRTFCEDAGFTVAKRHRVIPLLQRGISAGLFSEQTRQNIPAKLWTVDDNGWIYEFAITNVEGPLYHGYPVRRSDAMARKVIDRFAQHVARLVATRAAGREALVDALRAAQDFYN